MTATATRRSSSKSKTSKIKSATEQREINWTQLIETALTAPGSVGDTYCRFYNYSFLNQMLILMQGVCEPVATYDRWLAMGRQVQRGSKAKEIVRPVVIKIKDDQGHVAKDENGKEASFLRFKFVRCLFTYSETDGDELPMVEPQGWDLDTALDQLDIKRESFAILNGNVQGYSHGRLIAINPVASDKLATTFHEVGHIVLGHTAEDRLSDYATHRGEMEFQAEAVSYLVMHELSILTENEASKARGYIQGWLRKERPSDLAIRQVFSATDKILRAGRAVAEESAA